MIHVGHGLLTSHISTALRYSGILPHFLGGNETIINKKCVRMKKNRIKRAVIQDFSYFCGRFIKQSMFIILSKTVYGVTKSRLLPLSVDYISIDVEIPRCHECKKVHDKFNTPYTIVFIIATIATGWYLLTKGSEWFDGVWYKYVFGIAATVVISTILTGIIALPLKYFLFTFFQGMSINVRMMMT